MAINDNNANSVTEQTKQSQQPGRSSTQNAAAPAKPAFSFGGSALFGAPISRSIGNEQLSKVAEALAEIYKSAEHGVDFRVLKLDRTIVTKLAYSAVVVCMTMTDAPNTVATHTLLIEATGDGRVMPVIDNVNGRNVEIRRFSSTAIDRDFWDQVDLLVGKAYPTCKHLRVEATVVPSSFDSTNVTAVHALALNTGMACSTELITTQPDFKDMNLAAAKDDATLGIELTFAHQSMEDAVGSPVRSDVQVAFYSKGRNNQNNNRSMNSEQRDVRFSTLSGFMDLVWNPVAQQTQNVYAAMQGPQPTQLYMPNFVITHVEASRAMTPAAVLLAIMTAKAASDNNNWMQAFAPSASIGSGLDLNDIGAIGVEANVERNDSGFGSRFGTKGDNFGLGELGQLCAAYIRPGLAISLDVANSGPQSWYTSVFAAAANGSSAAYKLIYEAANELTNGRFTTHFPFGTPMFASANNIVHLGNYTGRDGEKRDIRDVGYLQVANKFAATDPARIRAYSDTFTYTEEPLAFRLRDRATIIDVATGETAEYTGTAERITFSSALLNALTIAGSEAGFALAEIRTPMQASDFNNRRHAATYLDGAMLQGGTSFVTTSQFMGGNNNASYHQGGNRFGL